MKIRSKDWNNRVTTTSIEDALTPQVDNYDRGSVEAAKASAEAGLQAVGRMLASLVAHKVLTLDEALEISENTHRYKDYEIVQ